jgi:adenosine deaminase
MTDATTTGATTPDAFIEGLPKCELHVHIEGTLEPELRLALAERNGITLAHSTVEELRATYVFDSLTSFLGVYYPAMEVLRTARDFDDLAYAYLTKAASQNVRCAEIFFDPQAHTSRGVPFPEVIRGLRAAVVRAERELGVHAELILCMLRDLDPRYAMATLMESLPYKDWIIGIGLDSDERDNPPSKFADVYARARAEGYLLTMHCDIDQPGSIDNIRQALAIGVDRIDHGTNCVEDDDVVAELAARGIGLTCCPVSNSFVTADMKAIEMQELLARGVRVTINSDDPAYFGGYITENYLALRDRLALEASDLVQLAVNAATISWQPPAIKAALLQEIEDYASTA